MRALRLEIQGAVAHETSRRIQAGYLMSRWASAFQPADSSKLGT